MMSYLRMYRDKNDTLKIGELSDYVKFVRRCLTNLKEVMHGRN